MVMMIEMMMMTMMMMMMRRRPYFKDWRLLGVSGMRPTVIAFFIIIQGGSR